MSTYQISCTIGTTDPATELGLEIWVDNQSIFNQNHITETMPLTFDLAEDEGEHQMRFVMKGKTSDHTQLDAAGNIVKDASLIIKDVAFDDIKLNQIFVDKAIYTHDFNGTQPKIDDQFYGQMGCNGTVSLKFTTPVYLWLLEHL